MIKEDNSYTLQYPPPIHEGGIGPWFDVAFLLFEDVKSENLVSLQKSQCLEMCLQSSSCRNGPDISACIDYLVLVAYFNHVKPCL